MTKKKKKLTEDEDHDFIPVPGIDSPEYQKYLKKQSQRLKELRRELSGDAYECPPEKEYD